MDGNFRPYADRTSRAGSASVVTVKLAPIPKNEKVVVEQLAATVYTTVHGDYVTAKYINLGFSRSGVKHYLKGADVGTGNTVVTVDEEFTLVTGDVPFADFEDTATSTTYELVLMGKAYAA